MGTGNEVTALLGDAHEPGKFCLMIRKEVDIGLTFARTAELEFASGNGTFGTRAARSALRIYTGVKNHMDNPYLGEHRRWVEEKLGEMEALLNGLRDKYAPDLDTAAKTA